MKRLMTGSGLAGLIFLGLAACAPDPDEGGASANVAANAAAGNSAAGNSAAAAAAPAEARPPLVLEGAGLGIPDASPPRILSFDTPKAAAIEAVTKALGRPPAELGENEGCGGSGSLEYAAWKDEITLYFDGGLFVGWDNDGKLKTNGGIGIGSSRADLATLPGLEIEESTLGTEFRSGGLSGILASKAPDAKVTALWGGDNCVFR